MRTLFESPNGLVHAARVYGTEQRAHTVCGREVNMETWTQIRGLDRWMFGKGPSTIAKKIELPKCERCFPTW